MGPNPHSCPYTTDTSRGKRRRGAWRRCPARPSGGTGPADTPTSGFQTQAIKFCCHGLSRRPCERTAPLGPHVLLTETWGHLTHCISRLL